MRVAVAGGTGLVGRFIVEELVGSGHEVVILSRRPEHGGAEGYVEHRAFEMGAGETPRLDDLDALVHAALDHLPGRYRGGEGNDPEGFRARNADGTRHLLAAAARAGVGHLVFLSSRAVYGDYPAGTRLDEAMEPRPDTLYGQVKLAGERDLVRLASGGVRATVLRPTGVYGPSGPRRPHKWSALFDAFACGAEIAPRVSTEVHGGDLAAAIALVLEGEQAGTFNVSDIVLDRADLLGALRDLTGVPGRLPARSDPAGVSEMSTARLRAMGWTPRGQAGLLLALERMCASWRMQPHQAGLDRGPRKA